MIQTCGEVEFRLIEGSDEHIQLDSLLANFADKTS
jgi:DNA polymerase III delta prime subunit